MRVTEQEVRDAFRRAPDSLKSYVESDELFNAFHEIRKKHNLHLDQAGDLELALHATVLGLRQFNELPKLMQEILQGVTAEAQSAILKDFNEKVFVPLRNLSKKRAEEVLKVNAAEKHTPGGALRAAEMQSSAEAPPPVAPLPNKAPATEASVLEQKMPRATPPAPAVSQETSAPERPSTPPRYHGTDPYREPVE